MPFLELEGIYISCIMPNLYGCILHIPCRGFRTQDNEATKQELALQ